MEKHWENRNKKSESVNKETTQKHDRIISKRQKVIYCLTKAQNKLDLLIFRSY